YAVGGDQGDPEMDVAQFRVHHAAVHAREPVVDAGHHGEDGAYAHHHVEVCHHEVGIVYLDVQCAVGHDDAGEAASDEGGHHADAEQHGRREDDVAPPEGSDVVEHLHRAGDGDQQGGEHEDRAQEGVHAGDEHVVPPYQEAQEGDRHQ